MTTTGEKTEQKPDVDVGSTSLVDAMAQLPDRLKPAAEDIVRQYERLDMDMNPILLEWMAATDHAQAMTGTELAKYVAALMYHMGLDSKMNEQAALMQEVYRRISGSRPRKKRKASTVEVSRRGRGGRQGQTERRK